VSGLYRPDVDAPAHAVTENLTASLFAEEDPAREAAPPYRGVIIIEWPAPFGASPYSAMTGHAVEITDALTGKPVRTCLRASVAVDMEAIVTADLTLFADEDGEPLLDGEPVLDGGEIRTALFPFVVAEMRVRHA